MERTYAKENDITFVAQDEAEVHPVTAITISPASLNMKVAETRQLTATVLPANASDPAVKWVSTNKNVVTVDENGMVKAVSAGTANIKVSSLDGSNVSQTCKVTVTEVPIEKKDQIITGTANIEKKTAPDIINRLFAASARPNAGFPANPGTAGLPKGHTPPCCLHQ